MLRYLIAHAGYLKLLVLSCLPTHDDYYDELFMVAIYIIRQCTSQIFNSDSSQKFLNE